MSGVKMDRAQALEVQEIALNRVINETIARGNSPVQKFYAGAVVLVTGASGFLGKQLIEKLLRSCDIRKIYLLMRTYPQKSLESRVDTITNDMLFEYLHQTQPDFVNKLVAIPGDISEMRLGIDDKTWRILADEVNVIFHVAATINFVEPLKSAVLTNVRGTREMIKLARDCTNLKSMVHVSTAFCHATPERVNLPVLEEFYETPYTPELLINLVQTVDEANIDHMTPTLLGSWPNTYTFTKALAEETVRTMAGDLPVCIVRPVLVMPAYREPPGWVDKSAMNGPFGFILGACLGGLHVMYANIDNALDIAPVDYVNNAVIAAAHATVLRREEGDTDIKIYTVTNNRNPCLLRTLHSFLESPSKGRSLVSSKILWYGYLVFTMNPVVFFLMTWFLHFIPGYLVDGVLWLTGRRPRVTQLFKKAYKQNKIFYYFATNAWKFDDTNLYDMYQNLSAADRIIYNCDLASVNLDRYMPILCIGGRKFIIKDGLQNTDYGIKKEYVLRIINYVYLILYSFLVLKIIIFFFGAVQTLFSLSFRL